MKSRLAAALCALALSFPLAAAGAPPRATLPPGLPASAAAPQVTLPVRLFAPETRARSLEQAALSDAAFAVSGRIGVAKGCWADALWRIDPVTALCSQIYEARAGVQILTPVYCAGLLYWVEACEDRSAEWRIRVWDERRDRTELVRGDPHNGNHNSAVVPALSTDGERVYWYEEGTRVADQSSGRRLNASLYALTPGEKKPVLLRPLETQADWQPLRVMDDTLAVGAYEQGRWWIRVLSIAGGKDGKGGAEIARVALTDAPMDAQSDGRYAMWRQGGGSEYDGAADMPVTDEERALGRQARAEEEPIRQGKASDPALGGQLWLADLADLDSEPACIDAWADTPLLRPEGAYYVNESRALCFYSFALGRVLKLTPYADYLPALSARGDALLTLRAIDDGERTHYRAALIDVGLLQSPGWPPLE